MSGPEKGWDIAVVGAGAAGLMTAIAAGRASDQKKNPRRIILFDTRPKIGAKILISGGTRCNVTNRRVLPSDYEGGPKHFVRHVLEAFTPAQTLSFFEEIGVPLVLEPTGKFFPSTHSGKTVLEALLREIERAGVTLQSGDKIRQVIKKDGGFGIETEKAERFDAARVVLATGGLSYPETGSDGSGYQLALSLGHSLTKTVPALTPFLTDDAAWKRLSGIALEARLSFFQDGKKKKESEGPLLFTHFGFSGPAALDLSRHVASSAGGWGVEASFLPSMDEKALSEACRRFSAMHPARLVRSFFLEACAFPERFVDVFFEKADFDPKSTFARCPAPARQRLLRLLLHYPLEISGVFGYKKAEVTAGGVPLGEVRASTMESRLCPGLFFAGEILDIDGRIGGFNFQWAWSTGTVAGRAAVKSLS